MRRQEEAGKLGERRRALEVLAEEQAEALVSTLKELLTLDPGHRRAVEAAFGKAPQQRSSQTFSRVLLSWFIGRFNTVVPGIGFDSWEGNPPLGERDALTPGEVRSQEARSQEDRSQEDAGFAGVVEESRGG